MARPKGAYSHNIDREELTKLAKTGASQAEIAQRLGIARPTLERRLRVQKYRDAYEMGRGEMLTSLRAKQVQVALSGNVQMLKWLGEQYLGQSHSHRLVDKEGEDRGLDLASVRAYMQTVPDDGE